MCYAKPAVLLFLFLMLPGICMIYMQRKILCCTILRCGRRRWAILTWRGYGKVEVVLPSMPFLLGLNFQKIGRYYMNGLVWPSSIFHRLGIILSSKDATMFDTWSFILCLGYSSNYYNIESVYNVFLTYICKGNWSTSYEHIQESWW